jgi:hypothetical protein
VTIVLVLLVLAFAGIFFTANARRRAAREAAIAQERIRAAQRRPRVPVVSNNVKGVTASQTIQPLRTGTSPAAPSASPNPN